jgi:hypothetical protein
MHPYAWEAGYADGLAGRPHGTDPLSQVDELAYASGYVEGKAARGGGRTEEGGSMTPAIQAACKGYLQMTSAEKASGTIRRQAFIAGANAALQELANHVDLSDGTTWRAIAQLLAQVEEMKSWVDPAEPSDG